MMKINLSKLFAALRHPNFRLWTVGQMVSVIGTWMQTTAQGYLVYELTHSSAYLGIVAFANGLPMLLFSLFGGVIADRIPRRKLIIITQTSMMVLAFILAGLTFTGWVKPWHIVILTFLLGTTNSVDAPARQAFVAEMVDHEEMANAIALNSTIFNLGVMVGPAIAGLVYAWIGPAWCFTLNGISFLAVIISLALMKMAPTVKAALNGANFKKLTEGVRFVAGEPRIKLLLVYVGTLSIFGFSLMTLAPAWSVKILGGDVRTNGLMLSARGIGSVIGALLIAYIGSKQIRNKVWLIGWYILPAALIAFGVTRWIPGTLLLMVVLGWSLMSILNISNALIQSYVPDHLRGRVMSVYTMTFMGSSTVGSLLAGGVASAFGEPAMVIVSTAVVLLAVIGTFVMRKTIRQF